MARGTGLQFPRTGDVTVQAPNVIDADQYSNARAWGEIGEAGRRIADTGLDYLARAEHQRQVGYLAEQEVEIGRKRLDFEEQHRLDPKGFEAAWEAYTAGKLEQAEPWSIPHLTRALGGAGNASLRQIQSMRLARDESQDRERVNSLSTMAQNDVLAAAEAGTLNSPDGRARMQKFTGVLDSAVGARLMTKEKRDLIVDDTMTKAEGASAARAGIQVLQDKGPEAAEKFLRETVLENKSLSPSGRQQAFDTAMAAVRRTQTELARQDRALAGDIDGVAKAVEKGRKVPDEYLADLRVRVQASGNAELKSGFGEVEATAKFAETGRTMTPAALDARINGLPETATLARETGRNLLKTMRTEIGTDPLGWADRVGLQAVPRIDFGADNVTAQLQGRRAQAEAVAGYYGIPIVYFRPEEQVALEAQMLKGGPSMLAVAQQVSAGFGDAAPRAMAEISKNAPAVAHVGNLLAGNGSVMFAADFAEATKLRTDKEFKIPRWLDHPSEKIRAAQDSRTREVYGDAFFLAPDAGRAANEAAQSVFFARSARGSKATSPVLDDSPSKSAFDRALNEAAGARFTADGRQYGGVGNYKPGFWTSYKVLVPDMVRADRFRDVVSAVTDADLAALPAPPRTAEGKAYTAADLRAGVPVATNGGYRFALGDPASDDPKWIRGADGQPFVLDFNRMEPELRKRVPNAFIGGR